MGQIQNLKGFRDYLPDEAKKRAWLKNRMITVVEKWGYEPMETPTLEPLELFTGQIGDDEKLFYMFKDQGGRDVALRYDQTVPTCRVLGQYFDRLIFPFRRYQIQPAFRAEKPQKGRLREFTQFDIDIFGVASESADAEAIAVSLDVYLSLGFKNVKIIVNDRRLMSDIPYPAIVAIDKLKKIGAENVLAEMTTKGIEKSQAKKYLEYVRNLKPSNSINIIFSYLKNYGFNRSNFQFEPTLARSFSYSEGPIWEITIPEYEAGSVGGGERYDSMIKRISDQDIPGTGIAFGFDRTLEALTVMDLISYTDSPVKVMISVFNPDLWFQSVKTSSYLRRTGIGCELYPDPEVKLDKQLRYANRKNIPYVIIQGPDEMSRNTILLKNMKNGEQTEIPTEKLSDYLI